MTLLTLTRSHGGHGLGSAALFFADDLPLRQPSEELTVSHGNAEAIELEGLCPPDDVNEVHLSDLENPYTIRHEVDGLRLPVACGAYGEWEGLLAQMGVLVDPGWRRRGLHRSVWCGGPSLAAQMLDAGLVDELCLSTSPTVGGVSLPMFGASPISAHRLELTQLLSDDTSTLYARWQVLD